MDSIAKVEESFLFYYEKSKNRKESWLNNLIMMVVSAAAVGTVVDVSWGGGTMGRDGLRIVAPQFIPQKKEAKSFA